MFLGSLLKREQPSDGAAAALETVATGISPAFLDAAIEAEAMPERRRDRVSGSGEDMLVQALSAKILHGWLQNRHQTLYPLTLNFRVLRPEQGKAVVQLLAASLLCNCLVGNAETTAKAMRAWLASLNADADMLQCFNDALADPPPLHALLDEVISLDMAVYGYVAVLVALDARDKASARYLEFLQARFDLPISITRSAQRRFQR